MAIQYWNSNFFFSFFWTVGGREYQGEKCGEKVQERQEVRRTDREKVTGEENGYGVGRGEVGEWGGWREGKQRRRGKIEEAKKPAVVNRFCRWTNVTLSSLYVCMCVYLSVVHLCVSIHLYGEFVYCHRVKEKRKATFLTNITAQKEKKTI